MKDKYFIPEIEELHIGYECDWRLKKTNFINYPKNTEVYDWQKHTLTLEDFQMDELCSDFHNIHNSLVEFRTLYLTKEQIKQEGWKLEDFDDDGVSWFKKDNYKLIYFDEYKSTHTMVIKHFEDICFSGKIKSINEFRKLLKMLEINNE